MLKGMLNSTTKKKLTVAMKWAVIGGIVADVACLAGCYYMYRKLTRSREFRHKIYSYEPRILDAYYRANEKYGDATAREKDYKEWNIKKIDSFSFISHFGL